MIARSLFKCRSAWQLGRAWYIGVDIDVLHYASDYLIQTASILGGLITAVGWIVRMKLKSGDWRCEQMSIYRPQRCSSQGVR